MTPAARASHKKLVDRVIAVQKTLARQPATGAVRSIVHTQADVTRRVASASTSAARKLIS